ncbi:MAG: hypothetical protein D6B27_12165 [Gammaproteobacteria bacterium]|nr:MAG: hypothetical protein D6B27_12165 [Gammaproteobacteria bacterium]
MDIEAIVNNLSEDNAKSALASFLRSYLSPAFGALPKTEIEIIALNLLQNIGAINKNPEIYELVSRLKVTRSKARRLIYDSELRNSSEEQLLAKAKELLKKPLIQKHGELFVIEIENPLLSDFIQAQVHKLGYISDGSFSPSLIKLGLNGISALIEAFIPEEDRNSVKEVLIKAGAPDTSLRGVIKSSLKKIASKIASETGDALIEKGSEYISPIIDASINQIKTVTHGLFD